MLMHFLSHLRMDCVFGYDNGSMQTPEFFNQHIILQQFTGLLDKKGTGREVFEYDIINKDGFIVENYYENREILKNKSNFLIQVFGTKTWLSTYREAVE